MDTANGQDAADKDAAPAAGTDRRPVRDEATAAGSESTAQSAETPENDVPVPAAGIADRGRVRRVRVLLAVAAVVYALDIASKALVVATMHYGQPIRLLGPVLQLEYTRNPGAAFSIGEAYTIIFTAIAVGVIVVILRLSRSLFSLPWAIALGLLLGGAFGNLTDRIARGPGVLRGWVVDFLALPHWPIFNLADSAICVGGALMVLLAFRGLHPDGTDERAASRRPSSQGNSHGHGESGSSGHNERDAATGAAS